MSTTSNESPWRDLGVRAAAAIVLIPAVLACVWIGGSVFTLLLLLMGSLIVWEWCRMVFPENERNWQFFAHGFAVFCALFCCWAGYFGAALIALFAGWGSSLLLTSMNKKQLSFWRLIGVPYVVVPVLAMFFIRNDPAYGLLAIVWLLLVVWSTDTFAYFAGRLLGGPKLSPRFSPKKTWSGLAGGALGAGVVAAIVALWSDLPHIWFLALLGFVTAIISQCGDIFESAAKRNFNVKDSSNLIPGHGGVLDRLDGLLFAAIFCAGLGFAATGDLQKVSHFLSW